MTTVRRSNRSANRTTDGREEQRRQELRDEAERDPNGHELSWRIPQPSATYWPHVPSCEMPLPICTSANSRCRMTSSERGVEAVVPCSCSLTEGRSNRRTTALRRSTGSVR